MEEPWEDLEDTFRRRHEPPITDWLEMKDALSMNYLPSTYRSSLLKEWDRLKQGTAPVAEYIEVQGVQKANSNSQGRGCHTQ